jgi:glycosyltransferase involved in cell wall biosynthesis
MANTSTRLADADEAPRRPTILVLLGSYVPAYKAGGPVRSIANLVAAIGEEFHFRVVTQDRDLGDKLPFPGIVANRWVRVDQADVIYLQPGLRGFLRMYALLRSVDRSTVPYVNSFFARRFSMMAVFMRKLKLCQPKCLVLAPRGEFSPGALGLKQTRKRLYIRISRWLELYSELIWHASTNFEATDIRCQFPLSESVAIAGIIPGLDASDSQRRASHVAIASDLAGLALPGRLEQRHKSQGVLRAVFVSRLSRKKNLAGALTMLDGISGDVSLDIYGPAEDAVCWKECKGLIAALPANIRVQYCGQIEHARIGQVFADHDLFLFPTLGENYGHVICEALVSGCPVLVSDQTPWRNLEAEGVGWDLPLTEPERFRKVLQHCVDMGPEEHARMRTRAGAFGARRANDPATIEENRVMLRLAVGTPTLGLSAPGKKLHTGL